MRILDTIPVKSIAAVAILAAGTLAAISVTGSSEPAPQAVYHCRRPHPPPMPAPAPTPTPEPPRPA